MANAATASNLRQIDRLFGEGTVAGLSDHQLLDRFAATRDEVAFAALMARYGPMVLGVCRVVLRDDHAAEDAFQDTFLMLARKASVLRPSGALGGWLYRVARRNALRARVDVESRRGREREAMALADARTGGTSAWDDWVPVLHEEIDRLPERHRAAIVLCHLQGLTYDQAARELRWTEPTLRCRLARARAQLRRRLTRRGLSGAGAALATWLDARPASAMVPPAWTRAAVLAAAGGGSTSLTTTALIASMWKAMSWARLKEVVMIALTLGTVLAIGLFATNSGRPGPDQPPMNPRPDPPRAAMKPATAPADTRPAISPKDERGGTVEYRGRIIGPDGRPVAGAKLYLTVAHGYAREPFPSPEYATTGPAGRFEFTVPRAKYGDLKTVLAAMGANHGGGWLEVPAGGIGDDLTIRLVDDVPITGQVVDLEGKPVAGATLRVLEISAAPGEDLGPWLEAAQGKKGGSSRLETRDFRWDHINVSQLALIATTDAEGHLRLAGIGRNRLVRAQLDGPVIASQYLNVLTRLGTAIEVTESKGHLGVATYYGANFRYVAGPTKPVVGVVRDRSTGKPLAGVTVESNKLANDPAPGRNIVQTMTDAVGRYRLAGLPKGDGNKIRLVPRDDQPYVSVHAVVPDTPGLDPVTVDFELKRGIWIEGKLTDKVTGKPVRGYVDYFALEHNPNVRDYPGFEGTMPPTWGVETKEDGSFRVVGLPGPGLIAVFYTGGHLLAPERDDEYGTKERFVYTSPRQLGLLINYTALARVDPAEGVESVNRNVTLDPGWSFTGTVLGPDRKPLLGVRSFGLTNRGWSFEAMKTAEFTVQAFNPRRPRDLLFQHPETGLVGAAHPPKENGDSVTVQMEPGATLTGRLLDRDGKPQAAVALEVRFRHKGSSVYFDWSDYSPARIVTDQEGRFRVEALLPDYEFRISAGKGDLPFGGSLRSGQTKDLGDVQMMAAEE